MKYKYQRIKNFIPFILQTLLSISIGFLAAYFIFTNDLIKIETSLLISLCAFFLTLYHFYQIRLHNRLSVKPLLLIGFENLTGQVDRSYHIAIIIKNVGLGVANVQSYKILYNGVEITLNDLYQDIIKKSNLSDLHNAYKIDLFFESNFFVDGFFIGKDEVIDIIRLKFIVNENYKEIENIKKCYNTATELLFNKTKFILSYSSLYNEIPKKLVINEKDITKHLLK